MASIYETISNFYEYFFMHTERTRTIFVDPSSIHFPSFPESYLQADRDMQSCVRVPVCLHVYVCMMEWVNCAVGGSLFGMAQALQTIAAASVCLCMYVYMYRCTKFASVSSISTRDNNTLRVYVLEDVWRMEFDRTQLFT